MDSIRMQLEALAEPTYRDFHRKLCPGMTDNLGVRLPALRKFAKELAKGDWRKQLTEISDDSYEEVLLQGMIIGYAKMELQERLERIETFVPKINNWATCDTFCATLSFAKKAQESVWDFLQPYLQSEETYAIRFGVVMLLDHFMTPRYLPQVLLILDGISHEDYYVKMAVAWAVSVCYVKDPQQTTLFLQQNHLDDFTQNKSIQKIRESLRVSKAEKEALLQWKHPKVSRQ